MRNEKRFLLKKREAIEVPFEKEEDSIKIKVIQLEDQITNIYKVLENKKAQLMFYQNSKTNQLRNPVSNKKQVEKLYHMISNCKNEICCFEGEINLLEENLKTLKNKNTQKDLKSNDLKFQNPFEEEIDNIDSEENSKQEILKEIDEEPSKIDIKIIKIEESLQIKTKDENIKQKKILYKRLPQNTAKRK